MAEAPKHITPEQITVEGKAPTSIPVAAKKTGVKQPVPPQLAKTAYKPGQSGNPSGRPPDMMKLLFEQFKKEVARKDVGLAGKENLKVTFFEAFIMKILASERLTEKFMDKLMKNADPQQLANAMGGVGGFEMLASHIHMLRQQPTAPPPEDPQPPAIGYKGDADEDNGRFEDPE